MRRLHLALFAEGPTDHPFLRPVLRRLVEDLCCREGVEDVETVEPLSLTSPNDLRECPRADRICGAAKQAASQIELLFIHSDAGGDAAAALAQRVNPAAAMTSADPDLRHIRVAGVVPVRETEAWCLADGEALRAVLRTTLDDAALGLSTRAAEAERELDPKRRLNDVLERALGRRGARRMSESGFRAPLGETVNLAGLRQLASFSACEVQTRRMLAEMGIIR